MKKNNHRKPKVISLFAGCGGLDLGFFHQGYEIVWANDIDKWAVATYRHNLGEAMICKDIEQVNPYKSKSIRSCDLILGGFTCQDFSVIWKRPGLNGERGNLYKSFLRFVDAKKPKAFVAEN
ncbi:MAG: DNA cytosine methyltransferase, partial [Nitrospirae bacterium]|nr:DNA cytosine methyltransferase [Nitrospirota bacterium]